MICIWWYIHNNVEFLYLKWKNKTNSTMYEIIIVTHILFHFCPNELISSIASKKWKNKNKTDLIYVLNLATYSYPLYCVNKVLCGQYFWHKRKNCKLFWIAWLAKLCVYFSFFNLSKTIAQPKNGSQWNKKFSTLFFYCKQFPLHSIGLSLWMVWLIIVLLLFFIQF